MTDTTPADWEPGYARKTALARLEAAQKGGEPYEPRPEITLRLSHPTNNTKERAPAVLLIEDEVSGQTLFELELSDAVLHDLLANRTARPHVHRYTRRPHAIGMPETMWNVVCDSEADADLMAERLRGHGWAVSEHRTKTRNPGRTGPVYLYPVTGRRWDGEPAGTVCPTCRYPLPNEWAAKCYECAPLIGKPVAL